MFPGPRCEGCGARDACALIGALKPEYPRCRSPLRGIDADRAAALLAWLAETGHADAATGGTLNDAVIGRLRRDRNTYSDVLEGSLSVDRGGAHLYRFSYAFPGFRSDPVGVAATLEALCRPFGDHVDRARRSVLRAARSEAVSNVLFGFAHDGPGRARVKLYLQFGPRDPRAARALAARLLSAHIDRHIDEAEVLHMIGLDIGDSGLVGAKLYFAHARLTVEEIHGRMGTVPLVAALADRGVSELRNVLLIHRVTGSSADSFSRPVEIEFSIPENDLRWEDVRGLAPARTLLERCPEVAALTSRFHVAMRSVTGSADGEKLTVYYAPTERERAAEPSLPTPGLVDIAGHDLGHPFRVVEVRTKADLVAALSDAREAGRPFAVTGLRATYWHNLRLEGAVVADLRGYDAILATNRVDGYVTVESGITLRRLDRHLREHGAHLPMHPDAFGDTPVASSIANGSTAGIGMLWGAFDEQVLGFEVLLGDGRLVQVGASRMLSRPSPAIARGLPDLRSFFFGAEGSVGVLTEIDFALVPTPWEARLTWKVQGDRFAGALACAQRWRRRGCAETIRWAWTGEGELRVVVVSRVSLAELQARVDEILAATFAEWPPPHIEVASERERQGELPEYNRAWPGPPGATWSDAVRAPFAGIDGVVPYSRADEAYAWARSLRTEGDTRVVAYFAPDGVNLGVHCSFADDRARARGRAMLEARLGELAAFDAVPYRPGVVWLQALRDELHRPTRGALLDIARALDPGRRIGGAGVLLEDPTDGTRHE